MSQSWSWLGMVLSYILLIRKFPSPPAERYESSTSVISYKRGIYNEVISISGLKIAQYWSPSYLGQIWMDFASIWVILKHKKVAIYPRTERTGKAQKPAGLKCWRLGFRSLNPTWKPESLARPVRTIVGGSSTILCLFAGSQQLLHRPSSQEKEDFHLQGP